MPSGTDDLGASLARVLAEAFGAPVRITDLEQLAGGASRETWAFSAAPTGSPGHELILRRDPTEEPGNVGAARRELEVLRAAARAGLAVPEVVVGDERGDLLGAPGMVMNRISGETIGRRIIRDERLAEAREGLAAQCGRFLGALHGLPVTEVPSAEEADSLAECWRLHLEYGTPNPTFEFAYRWLVANRPRTSRLAVVHGDFRLGNLIVDEQGLAAVIDWERVHLGDPMEDLAWLCVKAWRYGADEPVGGFGSLDALFGAYEEASGRSVDRSAFQWWLVMQTMLWGALCERQAAIHLRGLNRSVELAAVGRRVCEQEWDLLELLAPVAVAEASAHPPPATGEAPAEGLHGRPTVDELLQAVEEYLREIVVARSTGRVQFHGRVATNVVGIVRRELLTAGSTAGWWAHGLRSFGADSAAELVELIRSGALDDRTAGLTQFLSLAAWHRLSVANPRHITRERV